MTTTVGDTRVSTFEQLLDLQQDALTAAGCTRIVTDTASGGRSDRPGLQQALDYVRAGDVLDRADLERHLHQPPLSQDGQLLRRCDVRGDEGLLQRDEGLQEGRHIGDDARVGYGEGRRRCVPIFLMQRF